MREPTEDERALIAQARSAAQGAYCPYSRFPVGAVVETERGVFVGCNIENASYSLAICAERVALFAAIAAGAQRLTRLAVSCVRAAPTDPTGSRMPCGACRQVIAEFMLPESVVCVDGAGVTCVEDLLPDAFQQTEKPFLSHLLSQDRLSQGRL